MPTLHRHQLVWPTAPAWADLCAAAAQTRARPCLDHWAAQQLPLVVTRQPPELPAGRLAVALAAPLRWERQRLALQIGRSAVARWGEFPLAGQATDLLPLAARAPWRALCADLQAVGVQAHVYGSYGWQLLSGLDHVRASSDMDLWVGVADAAQADAVCACLQRFASPALRLDGELLLAHGGAVAWREWAAWRQGAVRSLLVKSLDGCTLGPLPGAERVVLA